MAATLITGKNMMLFVRAYKDRTTKDAARNRFQTEHSISMSKDVEATPTKDGIINTIADGENTVDLSSLAYRDDETTIETWKDMRTWFKGNELVELWQVDIESGTDGADLEAEYFQGYLTTFDLSAPAEGNVELSFSYAINGMGAEGTDTLTPEQLQAVQNAQYDYKSLKAEAGI